MNIQLPRDTISTGDHDAGETMGLLRVISDALQNGSGLILMNGKGDDNLLARTSALASAFGREDDVLVLDFRVASGSRKSNTFNPFALVKASAIRELLVSQIKVGLMGATTDNNVFMDRAVFLLGALTPVLVWVRDNKGIPIDIERIRFATQLESIASLAFDKKFLRRDADTGTVETIDISDIEPALLSSLSTYLGQTGGYDKDLSYDKQTTDEPARQHAFITMYFSAAFTRLAVSLGHIFKCESGDIDMRDVVFNSRILIVNLPTLEASDETTVALSNIVMASLRSMITQTLVDRMEGDADQTVTNKTRVSPPGCLVVLDEVAFYALSGMEKVFAMGRAVGITFHVSGQKAPGFTDHVGGSMQSLLGNANLHIPMKPRGETGHEVERMAGESQVARRKTVFALWWSRHPIRIRMKQAAARTPRSQETA